MCLILVHFMQIVLPLIPYEFKYPNGNINLIPYEFKDPNGNINSKENVSNSTAIR